jgi:AcrR family transcriptional regulator
MLTDAAFRVMARTDYSEMSIDDVLAEAGLSTRAFYRHFESKPALFDALMVREAESAGRSLARVVAKAPDPVAAVEAWLNRYLDVYYEPRRAERAQMLATAVGRGARLSDEMRKEIRSISSRPLVEALRAGHEAGVLYSPTPEVDAYSIHDLVTTYHGATDAIPPDREAARAHVMRFAWPAVGLKVSPPVSVRRAKKAVS